MSKNVRWMHRNRRLYKMQGGPSSSKTGEPLSLQEQMPISVKKRQNLWEAQ